MYFSEKWQLAWMNSLLVKSTVIVIHFVWQKKSWRFHYSFKSAMYLLKFCSCKLNIASNNLKSKESLIMAFERLKRIRVSPNLKINMSYLEIKIYFQKIFFTWKKGGLFHFLISANNSLNDSWFVTYTWIEQDGITK